MQKLEHRSLATPSSAHKCGGLPRLHLNAHPIQDHHLPFRIVKLHTTEDEVTCSLSRWNDPSIRIDLRRDGDDVVGLGQNRAIRLHIEPLIVRALDMPGDFARVERQTSRLPLAHHALLHQVAHGGELTNSQTLTQHLLDGLNNLTHCIPASLKIKHILSTQLELPGLCVPSRKTLVQHRVLSTQGVPESLIVQRWHQHAAVDALKSGVCDPARDNLHRSPGPTCRHKKTEHPTALLT
mmetsp:Transcript_50366/g.133755  ORF Transcript_50366/g.133755 Transcript_50366/m.133755 type:complete len:238 (+) Transcript_50366:885-1598(+)